MRKSISKATRATWAFWLCCLCCFGCLGGLVSCSEEDPDEDEYANWQERNDEAIASWASNGAYRKILTYTKNESVASLTAKDYIYVEEIESGLGTESPLFTDSVRVAYRARLIPTASYPEGLVIDQSFVGDFDWSTIGTADGADWVVGFSTALQNMHQGDYWRVYVPYDLAYGSVSASVRPSYSNIVFDIALVDFWPPGETHPAFKARAAE